MTETVDTNTQTESNASEQSLDYEAKATEIGWAPKDKFRGRPDAWVDAKTYFEKGEFVLPIVKQQRDEAKKDAAELRKEVADMKKAMGEFQKFTEDAAERKYKADVAQLKEAKANAVEAGDKTAFKQAEDALDELREAKPKPVEVKPTQTGDPEFETWVKDNDWYISDAPKRRLANAIGLDLTQENPNLRGAALFKAVSAEMERIETEKSGTERPGPQRGGKATGSNSKARTFDNLPKEYKDAYSSWERKGIKMTKEQYVSKVDADAWGA
jgi:hypothetical protein